MTFSNSSTVLTAERGQSSSVVSETNRIKKLPPLLVNQLAAGEVVTRPASVVKELIENAIDAGAKNIDIRITQGGMGVIEVSDDGCGIHPDDMIMAVTRFATSKIADVAHLQGIATLGFRGEALAATAAVSRLTLTSCSDDSGIGRELNVAGILDDTPKLTPVVHARGTTVTVRDLYFNVPARRGNLKSISTEYAHIEMVVKQLALVASDVSFNLWHNDKRRFNFESIGSADNSNYSFLGELTASESMPSVLRQSILARLLALIPTSHNQDELFSENNLQPININLEGLRPQHSWSDSGVEPLSINGFLIPSVKALANSSYKLIYINGRLVKDRRIAQSIRDCAAHLPGIDSVGYVLFFNLPKAWLNLNVHPSKQCIKIQNLANVTAHLEVGVRDALELWRHRQPKPVKSDYRTQTTMTRRTSSYEASNYKGKSSLVAESNNPPQIKESTVDYKVDVHPKVARLTNRSVVNGSVSDTASNSVNSLDPIKGADLSYFKPVAADIATDINQTALSRIRCMGVLAKNEIVEEAWEKATLNTQIRSNTNSLTDSEYLALIESNQTVYLFSEQGIHEALNNKGVSFSATGLDKDEVLDSSRLNDGKIELMAYLNKVLEQTVGFPQSESINMLTEYALTELSIMTLTSLMLERL